MIKEYKPFPCSQPACRSDETAGSYLITLPSKNIERRESRCVIGLVERMADYNSWIGMQWFGMVSVFQYGRRF